MDFIVRLSRNSMGYDSILMIVAKLTKSTHFLLIKMTYSVARLAQLYNGMIMCLHDVLISVVLD